MRKVILSIVGFTLLSFLSVSCKKEDSNTPINVDTPTNGNNNPDKYVGNWTYTDSIGYDSPNEPSNFRSFTVVLSKDGASAANKMVLKNWNDSGINVAIEVELSGNKLFVPGSSQTNSTNTEGTINTTQNSMTFSNFRSYLNVIRNAKMVKQ